MSLEKAIVQMMWSKKERLVQTMSVLYSTEGRSEEDDIEVAQNGSCRVGARLGCIRSATRILHQLTLVLLQLSR